MDYGLTAYHYRLLCECPMNGGQGYLPQEVGNLTPDQVYFLLCDKDLLKREVGQRTKTMEAMELPVDKDGFMKGRDKDGNPLKGRIQGKSVARVLMEQEEARLAAERAAAAQPSRRKGRRKRRG